ncbi:aldehyde dehydrogenase family protein, partial [Oceanicola sp. S124]|uniref:aldehyde dehydrogenase family protein n=1 Tax=Oceanicola sp. S124 TaxID=1042378 RepID=UPI000255967D
MATPALPQLPEDLIAAYAGVNLVGGAKIATAATLPVMTPATGAQLGLAAASDAAETAAAIEVAATAFPAWSQTPARARGKLVAEAARALSANAEVIAQVLARETGKAIRTECRGEVATAIDILDFYAGLGSELK